MAHCSKTYMKDYMREFIRNSTKHTCNICGGSFRDYNQYKHKQSKKHQFALQKEAEPKDDLKESISMLQKQIEQLKQQLSVN